jgi:hypothetical protein
VTVVNFLICSSRFRFAPVFSLLKVPVRKAFGSSVSALTLPGLSDVSDPAGSSTLRTWSRVTRGSSFFPGKKDGNAAAHDGDN